MHMAWILADMPDLWHRILTEHVSDSHGRCVKCRDRLGAAAPWPCVTRQVAAEARAIYEGKVSSIRVAVPQQRRQAVW